MPRAIDHMCAGGNAAAGKHIDAYQEYSNVVGRLDGGKPLPGEEYEAIRKRAADGTRRLYVNWRNTQNGIDCRAIGPQSMCFCTHRYNEHDWEAFETRRVRCKMPGCTCTCFNHVPVRGSQDLQCCACHRSFRDHCPETHKCPVGSRQGGTGTFAPKGGGKFASSYNCSCTATFDQHETVFESRAERDRAGRPIDAGWMETASKEGLPVCHLGGIIGFTSLADGIDRAYAGLEGDSFGGLEAAMHCGAVGDSGANRFVRRMQLEDEVNTASLVHGKAAGHRVIADHKRQQQREREAVRGLALPKSLASSSSDFGVTPAPVSGRATSVPLGRANIHGLGSAGEICVSGAVASPGRASPGLSGRGGGGGCGGGGRGGGGRGEGGGNSGGGRPPRAASHIAIPKGGQSSRPLASRGSGGNVASGGPTARPGGVPSASVARRLGGDTKPSDPEVMRLARLARFEPAS
eukprot:TRINITY_DN31964_c0_g1_i1.p1 TRINITY_DN31964_c0_g1~~TRINITY_DN31964_c0_g1_i1.p1  ORF type:complete len:473 (+),score=64.18 TRINITY_DN31964_c0_g1_i1:32-1420(+)